MTHTVTVKYKYFELIGNNWVERTSSATLEFDGEIDESIQVPADVAKQVALSGVETKMINSNYSYDENNLVISSSWKNVKEQLKEEETEEPIGSKPEPESPETTREETKEKPTVETPTATDSSTIYAKEQEILEQMKKIYIAGDPRIWRYDEFLLTEDGNHNNAIRVPFASDTIASAFADLNWTLEKKVVELLVDKDAKVKKNLYVSKYLSKTSTSSPSTNESSEGTGNTPVSGGGITGPDDQQVIVNDPTPFEKEPFNYGTLALMNPYALTKLAGGIDNPTNAIPDNYMYDIRDRRRFYGVGIESELRSEALTVNSPSYSNIIKWSNSDKWGRTPYSWLDFVYCKYFGIIPTNRLITLRRYSAPTYDNLQFEAMYGEIENQAEGTTTPESKENVSKKTFSPHATVVTYFGGESGNTLGSLMNFSTGIKWTDLKSKIHEVSGDEGLSPQEVIDKLLDGGGGNAGTGAFGTAAHEGINSILSGSSLLSGKIVSYGKFALSANGNVPLDNEAVTKLYAAQVDPYDSIFQNRVLGPLNRIETIKKREPGIEFSQPLTIKCSYKAKAIGGAGGVNVKAAMLDIMANCMEIVSPTAVFWGGGHRFMILPHVYPYHDGGWRDNFMKKIYDGNFLGDDGAIAFALKGIKKVGQKNGQGEFSWDNMKANLGSVMGEGMAMLGSAISNISSMLGGGNFLDLIGQKLQGGNGGGDNDESNKSAINNKITTFFSNLKSMWTSKMIKETTLPTIKGMGALLIGEPVGEWHLTIGNPLNPIMVIGNLVCSKMDIAWDEELGPDDFPTGFTVTYSLEHGMPRDKEAIQSMFNRGMGKIYALPDYISLSSNRMTHVDKFTDGAGSGDTGSFQPYMDANAIKNATPEYRHDGYNLRVFPDGTTPLNHGNANTQLVTKFSPIIPTNARRTVQDMRTTGSQVPLARVRSLAATRKLMS